MIRKTSKTLILTAGVLTLMFAMTISTAFATHGNTGESWTESEQEYFCHSNLSQLNITSTVTDSMCDIIGDAADDWNGVANSDWELTKSSTSAIDFRSVSLGQHGYIGKMYNFDWFGTIITANVKFNRDVNFGDSTVDNNVYDIYTVIKHEMGHIPTLFHNLHAGDENTSVMRPGPELGFNAQRTITANDAAALAGKY